jgi:plasmid stabilization system protein ParE
LIGLSRTAKRHVADLLAHYARLRRLNAGDNLLIALEEAAMEIDRNPGCGLPAPRPYPNLVRPGIGWVKARRYWIAYRLDPPHEIVGVFFETADIPRRF